MDLTLPAEDWVSHLSAGHEVNPCTLRAIGLGELAVSSRRHALDPPPILARMRVEVRPVAKPLGKTNHSSSHRQPLPIVAHQQSIGEERRARLEVGKDRLLCVVGIDIDEIWRDAKRVHCEETLQRGHAHREHDVPQIP
eukprot:CAMPEP_0119382208 /NCGR_PEP_ID=MMETSP1334-20130426/70548_1 /TAXON_ID=127549 /ORGANISM="Calcidiscus leptoporus, Strain RCC1130" /LENGTH=138 /DNA_ID=CAMNT_0007402583 /DNA_START=127 /DNA_END=543 /DNA_ORIENTATION=+